jgi:GNAT superfamily N-acetyltransferase
MEKLDEVRVGTPDGLKISSLEVARFYSENWQRKLAFEIPSFYQWQFRDPPANQGKDLNCVAIDSAGHILGVMGLNQRPFWLAGKLRNGAELTTWVVSPLARGKGVGRAIMNYLQARYDVLSGSGITDDALQIYLTSGFRFLRQHPRFVRVWHLEAIRPHSLIKPLGDKLANLRLKPPAAMQFRLNGVTTAIRSSNTRPFASLRPTEAEGQPDLYFAKRRSRA